MIGAVHSVSIRFGDAVLLPDRGAILPPGVNQPGLGGAYGLDFLKEGLITGNGLQ
jgi:hypothetical protein